MASNSSRRTAGRGRPPVDPEVARALMALGLTRRRFLRNVGTGGVLLGGGTLLSACGISGDQAESGGQASEGGAEASGELNFSNWTLYIDVEDDDETASPTFQQFEEESGITVNYFEDINSNEEYFAQIREQLDAGEDIGRDLMVLTDWMGGRLISLGWLSEINTENIPNASNLLPGLQDASFDPDRSYSLPWQSGLTGIGYNRELAGRDLTSVNDLFSDEFSGRISFLTEMRDTMGLVMASMDIDPLNHEFSEYEQAIERLQQAVDSGQVRQIAGGDYVSELSAGNIAAATAWSGDIFQLQLDDENLQFAVPDEGALLWSDNMLIPANAANQPAAEAFMDYVYQPEIAAQIAAWVNYITPVSGAQEAMMEIDESLAESEFIFPTEESLSNTFDFKQLDEDEEEEYQNLFQGVIGA